MPKPLPLIIFLLYAVAGWTEAEITTPHDLPVEITLQPAAARVYAPS